MPSAIGFTAITLGPATDATDIELHSQHAKFFRFRKGKWQAVCAGKVKLLKSGATGKVSFFMREDESEAIRAEFVVCDAHPYCVLQPNARRDQCWFSKVQDCCDGERMYFEEQLLLSNSHHQNLRKCSKAKSMRLVTVFLTLRRL